MMWCRVCKTNVSNENLQCHQDTHVAQYKINGTLTSIVRGTSVDTNDSPASVLAAFENYNSGEGSEDKVKNKLFN